MNQWFNNPFFQMGAGILAANRPGVNAGQAIGLGMLTGMNQYQRMQAQNMQAEKLRMELDTLKESRERHARLRQQLSEATRPRPYAMTEEELFPGETGVQGLGREPTEAEIREGRGDALEEYLMAESPMEYAKLQASLSKTGAPTLKTVQEGNESVTYQVGTDGSMVEVARGPKWNPKAGPMVQNIIGSGEQQHPILSQYGPGAYLVKPGDPLKGIVVPQGDGTTRLEYPTGTKEYYEQKKRQGAPQALVNAMDQLKRNIQTVGQQRLPGAEKGRQEAIVSNLRMLVKEAEELGAIQGADMQLINQIIGDPTSLMTIHETDPQFIARLEQGIENYIARSKSFGIDIDRPSSGGAADRPDIPGWDELSDAEKREFQELEARGY